MIIARRFAALIMVAFVAGFLAGCAGDSKSESTGEYVDDVVISNKVRAEIVGDDELSLFDIDVETFKGTVQLSGFVDSEEQKTRAGEVARRVEGVKEVSNNLVVK